MTVMNWTADDWIKILGALGIFIPLLATSITTIILQLRGNAKTNASAITSADNNLKLTAVVAQTREIARVTDGASTEPTDKPSVQRPLVNTGTIYNTGPITNTGSVTNMDRG